MTCRRPHAIPYRRLENSNETRLSPYHQEWNTGSTWRGGGWHVDVTLLCHARQVGCLNETRLSTKMIIDQIVDTGAHGKNMGRKRTMWYWEILSQTDLRTPRTTCRSITHSCAVSGRSGIHVPKSGERKSMNYCYLLCCPRAYTNILQDIITF